METLTDILAEKGIDLEDHLATIKKERELARSFGVDLEEIFKPKSAPPKEEKKPVEDD